MAGSIGDVQPNISPGDNGLHCGTVIENSFRNTVAVDCKEATNCTVLTSKSLLCLSKLAESMKCLVSNGMSTNTYKDFSLVVLMGIRQL